MDFKEATKQLRANLEGAIRRRDKAVSRATTVPPSRRRNRERWVSLKIGLVRHVLCRGQCLSPPLCLSPALALLASPCIYSLRLFHPFFARP